jgi:hypothetical protein
MPGLREAHFHHRQQTMATRKQLGLVTELGEQTQRVRDGPGGVILEFAGNHAALLLESFLSFLECSWQNALQQL